MVWFEVARIRAVEPLSPAAPWLTEWDSEVTLPLLVLLTLPILMKVVAHTGMEEYKTKTAKSEEAKKLPQTATPRPPIAPLVGN